MQKARLALLYKVCVQLTVLTFVRLKHSVHPTDHLCYDEGPQPQDEGPRHFLHATRDVFARACTADYSLLTLGGIPVTLFPRTFCPSPKGSLLE